MNRKSQHTSRFVAIGGGHGLSRVLSAFSHLGDRLTGIVTTTDNGGSSGQLRRDLGCVAWGDARRCLTELVANPSVASLLFEYRFNDNDAGVLVGQSLGNVVMAGVDRMCARPMDAMNMLRELLGVRSGLIPMTEQACDLVALTEEGEAIHGETAITENLRDWRRLNLSPIPSATPEAVHAITHAEVILLGPGSFYTSVLPPLLIPELRAAFRASTAAKIWLPNMTPTAAGDSPSEVVQWRWLQRTLGPDQITAVLWPGHRPMPLRFNARVTAFDLLSPTEPGRHDRHKLVQGVDSVLQTLAARSTASARDESARAAVAACRA